MRLSQSYTMVICPNYERADMLKTIELLYLQCFAVFQTICVKYLGAVFFMPSLFEHVRHHNNY